METMTGDVLQYRLISSFLEANSKVHGLIAVDAVLSNGQATIVVKTSDRSLADVGYRFLTKLDGEDVEVEVKVEDSPPFQFFLSGQAHLPVPPQGNIYGGDPVWHPLNGWGTLALSSPQVTIIDHTNTSRTVPNAVLSCNHILALIDRANSGDRLSNFRSRAICELNYFWPITNVAIDPIDLAIGRSQNLGDYQPREVRGLGQITGVSAPSNNERVFKSGARTSITTALDDGVGSLFVSYYANRSVFLRKTTANFADVGDSGAAVLNENRRLVGFVVGGLPTSAGMVTYYLPTRPLGDPAPVTSLSVSISI